jgi:hypothetical protein
LDTGLDAGRGLPAGVAATAATTTAAVPAATTAAATTEAAATTAAAATEAAATAAATTTAAAEAAAALARAGLVDGEVTTIDVLAVQALDRGLAGGAICKLNEPESTGTTGLAIHHERRADDLSILLEDLAQAGLGGLERQITDVKLHLDAFPFPALETMNRCLNSGRRKRR